MRVQITIFKISNLGLPKHFGSGVAYGGSNPIRMGELGGNLLPPFPINRRREAVPNIPNPLGYAFQLFWMKKIAGASVMLS